MATPTPPEKREADGAAPPPVAIGGYGLPFPVVGIGASAGGLKALMTFFEHMPSGSGMSFVVVIHLSPVHESNVDSILRSVTRMPVLQVTEPVRIERDHVYVIPPNKHLHMRDGLLEPAAFSRKDGAPTSIDTFFRTLAAAHREHAIAIVLSGTGSDGAVGVKNIKEQGGITIVQAPMDAEQDAMPRNAIGTGVADFVMPVANMPERLLQLWHNMQQIRLPRGEEGGLPVTDLSSYEPPLREILQTLRERTTHDFSHYKRPTVTRRIERRLQVNELSDLRAYALFLRDHPAETRALLRDMLISVTNFFRDRDAFEALERTIVPAIFANKTSADEVRVWVAGCATGEEAYSIAMILIEYAEDRPSPPSIQVFATDIDEDAIAVARAGIYPEAIATDVPAARLRRFFARETGGYRVQKAVRERVMFAVHNVLRDPPFSRLDLVACRNLLIYLDRDVQARVLNVFHFGLRSGGYLMLGSSESVDEAGGAYVALDKANHLFQAREQSVRLPAPLYAGPSVVSLRAGNPGRAALGGARPPAGALGDLHLNLLEHYSPPSVVINEHYDIVHLSDKAGRFLQFAAGEPSLNLMKIVQPELRLELRAGLFQATQSLDTVHVQVRYARDGRHARVALTIHPVPEESTGRLYLLVIFDEQADDAVPPRVSLDDGASVQQQLEAELASTKDQLRDTIEQYETQNEELKASNEELQAINEELRSTTEELETSKEELQSINEELSTVNQEIKTKIDEATVVNNDLQNFIASTEIGVLFVDRSQRLLRWTPPVQQTFNVITTDLGRPLLDITHRLDYPELTADIGTVLEKLSVVEREVRSQSGRWYLARLLPYRTTDDRIEGAVITLVDITTRREAEERVRRSEEWMRFVVDSVRDYAIMTLDERGRVNSWNTGAQRMFGYAADEVLGKSIDLIFVPEDRAAGVPADEQRRAREEGRAADERWHLRKDGTRFYCSGIMAPLQDGEFYGYVKIARDLTEQQQAVADRDRVLQQERAARAQFEDTNRQKDQFLAMLSHELRNPLNLILMQAQLLLRTNPFKDAKSRHTAEVIYQTAATQSRLVDDLLDVSRVMTGKLAMQQHLVPLPFIVGDSIGAVARDAEQKGITLDVNLTAEPLIVQADPVRLRQIAWNLLTNAIKFTPSGGRVTVSLVREGDEARLDVVDNGQGIEAGALPHIFQLFGQHHSNLTRHQGGMGIGLALVQQLVELHGGRIDVHSEGRDRGARFTIWLPLYVVPAVDTRALPSEVREPAPALLPSPAADEARVLEGMRILVVDDGVDAVAAMHELLEMEGALVEEANSGADALEKARHTPFDVVVSDLAMPGMDGMALLRELRKLPGQENVAAVACSGFNRRQDVEQALAAGFDAHLSKPIGVRELVDAILRTASARRARS
jgi:two-component system CheB/CheR fusion protein